MSEVVNDGGTEFHAFLQAFIMIVVSEIGDKTFLIAAIMATRHARVTVFGGAFASLVVMSILSAALGRVILGLIPKVWTLWAAAILFLAFGIKMLHEAMAMSGGNSHIQDEMREVEEELEQDSSRHDVQNARGSTIPLEALEEGKGPGSMGGEGLPFPNVTSFPNSPSRRIFGNGSASGDGSSIARNRSPSPSPSPIRNGMPNGHAKPSSNGAKSENAFKVIMTNARNGLQLVTNPVFAQAFILTFLGEWGDRSQITTIAMAGAHSVPVIAFGTIIGHGLCTCGAVIGGRYLSTKISVKHITLIGAAAFLVFAVLYVIEAWYDSPDDTPPSLALR